MSSISVMDLYVICIYLKKKYPEYSNMLGDKCFINIGEYLSALGYDKLSIQTERASKRSHIEQKINIILSNDDNKCFYNIIEDLHSLRKETRKNRNKINSSPGIICRYAYYVMLILSEKKKYILSVSTNSYNIQKA